MNQLANPSAEVHAFPRRQSSSAFDQAKQELAAFKFSLFETVAADPLLRAGQCLNLIIVYASLVTIDKKTLQATTAYASNSRIYARAGLRSAHTAIKARRTLEEHGYLIPSGKTKGMTIYRLANPHQERVQMLIQEMEDLARERNSDRKRIAQTATLPAIGIAENAAPENHKDCNICTPRIAESARQGLQEVQPNTFKEYLTGLPVINGYEDSDGSPVMGDVEGERSAQIKSAVASSPDFPAKKKNGYALAANGENENTPFSAPASEQEADEFLKSLFGSDLSGLHERVLDGCRKRLMNGLLTPAFVRARLDALEKQPPAFGGVSHAR